MNTIDIRTSLNVVIEYELARLGERILAFIIDQVILWSSVGLLSLLINSTFDRSTTEAINFLIIYPIIIFYTLFFEMVMNGQTPGKKAMNLKAIKLNGREAGSSDYLIRWAFRPVDIWASLGMVSALLISSSEKNQRLGDTLSDMVIVKLKPARRFTLENILQIRKTEGYKVRYPNVVSLGDEEMLLVKNVLSRQRTLRNKAHDEATAEMAAAISARLGIRMPGDYREFLKNLLEDYIVLTR